LNSQLIDREVKLKRFKLSGGKTHALARVIREFYHVESEQTRYTLALELDNDGEIIQYQGYSQAINQKDLSEGDLDWEVVLENHPSNLTETSVFVSRNIQNISGNLSFDSYHKLFPVNNHEQLLDVYPYKLVTHNPKRSTYIKSDEDRFVSYAERLDENT